MSLASMTWQHTALGVASLAFTAFVLWLTASTFDASELKSLMYIAGGVVVREVLPIARRILAPTTDALARGGQLE